MVKNKHDDNVYIDGPTNVVRLEGKVDDTNKILYIFSDVHNPIDQQTDCSQNRSISFKQFLVKNFDKKRINNPEKKYDFFLEIQPQHIPSYKELIRSDIYLANIRRLFSRSVKMEKSADKMLSSDEFPNIRFHYMDVRLSIQEGIWNIFNPVWNAVGMIYQTQKFDHNQLINIYDGISLAMGGVTSFYKLLLQSSEDTQKTKPLIPQNIEDLSKYTKEDYLSHAKNITNKIKNIYDNKKVKDIMNKIINTELIPQFQNLFDEVKKYIQFLSIQIKKAQHQNEYKKDPQKEFKSGDDIYGPDFFETIDAIAQIYKGLQTISGLTMDCFVHVVDIYFLRRFLDKDYITNGIHYTGGLHTINLVYILIKYFDFKLTHVADPDGKSVDEINKLIKNSKKLTDVALLLFPEYLIQCSNLKGFPPLFE